MSHPLDGCWAKIDRAHEHLTELSSEIARTPDYRKAITFRQEFDQHAKTITVRIATVPTYPIRWGLIAADGLQNLRAALNYLVWELAKWNLIGLGIPDDPPNRVKFPIVRAAKDFPDKWLDTLDPAHVARIKEHQPYGRAYMAQFDSIVAKGANPEGLAAGHPLAILADLTNTDKHKVLIPAGLGASTTHVGPYEATDCVITHSYLTPNLRVFQRDAEWVRFDVTPNGSDPKVRVADHIVPRITFEKGWGIEPVFAQAGTAIVNLVREFEPVF